MSDSQQKSIRSIDYGGHKVFIYIYYIFIYIFYILILLLIHIHFLHFYLPRKSNRKYQRIEVFISLKGVNILGRK